MFKQGIIRWVAYAIILLITGGCGSALRIEGPQESYVPGAFFSSPSVLPIVAEIDLKGLEKTVNKKFDGLLYEDNGSNQKDLEIKVWKAGNFSVFVNNDEISYRIPLKIWSRFTWKVEKFGFILSDKYDATGSIALVYKTKLDVDNNWNVKTKTTSAGYSWIETPKLSVAGINIPVKSIADFALSRTEKLISDGIDKAIGEYINLRELVNGFWQDIQEPIKVDSTYNAWVRVIPTGVTLSPFSSYSGKLQIPITFIGEVETIAGSNIPYTVPLDLPTLGKSYDKPAKFNINLKADVTFDQIIKAAMQKLDGMVFSEGGKSIKVVGLRLYSSSGKAVLALDVDGSFKGRIFLTGDMEYDPNTLSISVKNADFDIKTRSSLVKSANWLLHGMILRKLQPYLTYNVEQMLEEVRVNANNMIQKYSLFEGVYLYGNLDAISVSNITMVPGAVRVGANLSGNVKLITTEF